MITHRKLTVPAVIVLAIPALLVATACAAPADPATESIEIMDHEEVEHEDEHEREDLHVRIPNDGAVIEIVAPADGAVFAAGEDVVVEVAIRNFTLNQDGSHWHVYLDGESYGMVVGETFTQVLRGLQPGQHTLSAFLANGHHAELEDGAEVMISITE